jgi:hypothetical protein
LIFICCDHFCQSLGAFKIYWQQTNNYNNAISHVSGQVERCVVHGLEERLLASPEKATLISDQLEGVVRAKHFWMDILCVDQLNTEARIAVTQHIPNIFMHASEALV